MNPAADSASLLLGPLTAGPDQPTRTGMVLPLGDLEGLDARPLGPPSIPGYAIERELGRGGMGVVYLARQLPLDRPVALKVILDAGFASPEQKLRFQFEAELAARVHHPNVVQVYDVGQHLGHPFISCEFVEGGTLQAALHQQKVGPRTAAALAAQLADGVHAAHSQGIIHRDLKPANVLLARAANNQEPFASRAGVDHPDLPASGYSLLANGSLTPKIADFGLAKRYEDDLALTRTGIAVGTPHYMAPEQARGEKQIGPAADIYALGAILYEALAGRTPFVGENGLDVLLQAQLASPAPLTAVAPQTPRDLAAICMKCLATDPARRYGSAAELAADLRRWLEGRPIHARPAGRGERLLLWRRRNPLAAALAASLLAALIAGVAATAAFAFRSERLRGEAERQAQRADGERDEANRQRNRAEEEARRARRAVDAMTTDQAFFNLGILRLTPSAEQFAFLSSAAEYYREQAERPVGSFADRLSAADARRRQGFLLQRLSRLQEAAQAFDRAIAQLRELCLAAPENLASKEALASALSSYGSVLAEAREQDAAFAAYQEAIALRRALLKQSPSASLAAIDVCDDLARCARLLVDMSDAGAAAKFRQEALALADGLAAEAPGKERIRELQLGLIGDAAYALSLSGKNAAAEALFRRGQEIAEALLRLEHLGPDRLAELARFYERRAVHHMGKSEDALAEPFARKALELSERLASLGPGLLAPTFSLAGALDITGSILVRLRRPEEAKRLFERGVNVLRNAHGDGEQVREATFRRMQLRRGLAQAAEMAGDLEAAEGHFRAAMSDGEALRSYGPIPGRMLPHVASFSSDVGFFLRRRGRTEEAWTAIAASVADARRIMRASADDPRAWERLGGNLCNQSVFERELGRLAEADQSLQQAEEALKVGLKLAPEGATLRRFLANCHIGRARLREAQQRFDEAATAMGQAVALASAADRAAYAANQAFCLSRAGRHDEAVGLVGRCLQDGRLDRHAIGCCALVFAYAANAEADDEERGKLELGGINCLRAYLGADSPAAAAALLAEPAIQQAFGATVAYRDLIWTLADMASKAEPAAGK